MAFSNSNATVAQRYAPIPLAHKPISIPLHLIPMLTN